MEILLGLFLVFVFAVNPFGSPLIYKTIKELTSAEKTEVGFVETAKYNQIRIKIINVDERAASKFQFHIGSIKNFYFQSFHSPLKEGVSIPHWFN